MKVKNPRGKYHFQRIYEVVYNTSDNTNRSINEKSKGDMELLFQEKNLINLINIWKKPNPPHLRLIGEFYSKCENVLFKDYVIVSEPFFCDHYFNLKEIKPQSKNRKFKRVSNFDLQELLNLSSIIKKIKLTEEILYSQLNSDSKKLKGTYIEICSSTSEIKSFPINYPHEEFKSQSKPRFKSNESNIDQKNLEKNNQNHIRF